MRAHRNLAWHLAWREVVKNKGRYLLAGLVIGLVVAVSVASATIYRSSEESPARQAQLMLGSVADASVEWHCSEPIEQDPVEIMIGDGYMANGLNERLATAFPGRPFVELRVAYIVMRSPVSVIDFVAALEGDLADPLLTGLRPLWRGALPTAPGEVAITRDDAKILGVGIGDTIEISLNSHPRVFVTARVVGIYRTTPLGVEAGLAPGTIPDSAIGFEYPPNPIWYLGGGDMSWDEVMTGNKYGFESISRSVLLNPPPPDQVPLYQNEDWEPIYEDSFIFAAILAYLAIGGTLVTLLIGPVFAVGARQSRRDYALLRAQGAEAGQIRGVMLRSAGLVGAVASALGAVLGVGVVAAADAIARAVGTYALPDLRVGWFDAPAITCVGTLIALISAWFPARSAVREDVVRALRDQETAFPEAGRVRPLIVAVGAIVTVASGALALASDEPYWLLVPGILGAVTLVVSIRLLVAGLAVLAPHLPLAARVSLRDAARRPDRTVPAATVIMGAIAAAVCASVVMSTDIATEAAAWALPARAGTLVITDGDYLAPAVNDLWPPPPADERRPEKLAQLRRAIEKTIPVTQMVDVNALFIDDDDAYPSVVIDPSYVCPAWADYTRFNGQPKNERYPTRAADYENCWTYGADSAFGFTWASDRADTIIVDDGTLVRALGLPGADMAAEALAAGKVVVARPVDMWPDGTVHIAVKQAEFGTTLATVIADAVLVDWQSQMWQVFIPPSLVASQPLIEQAPIVRRVGVMAVSDQLLEYAQFEELCSDLARVGVSDVEQVRPYDYGEMQVVTGVTVAAALFALVITWGAARLAIVDLRPDLRVIYDVGATGRVRRRLAAGTTMAIGLLGSLTGVAAGLLLGRVLIAVFAYWDVGVQQVIDIPWAHIGCMAVAIPLVTAGLAWLAGKPTPVR